MYSLIGSVIVLLVLCHSLVGITFVKSDDCNNISGNLTIMEDIKFLFIGESAIMTCTINMQTIQNYSVENLKIRVNKCSEKKSLHRQIGQKNRSKEIHVRDVIEDLPCRDQIFLDYACLYDRKNSDSCIVGRKFIYFDYLTLTENIHFLFIGESANMTCSIQKQSIQNFSADNFIVTVKRCGVTSPLPKILNETSDLMEMYVTDLIRDLHCGDQIMLEYKCIYRTKNGSSCHVGERDLIYFDYLTLMEDFNFSFIGESVNLTCSINTQTIHNFSADKFTIKVKKCGVTYKLLPRSKNNKIKNVDIMEIFIREQIKEPLCDDQNWLNYKCYYDVKKDTSCEVGEEKVIYFDFRPSPVKSFHCLVYNWFNMTCWFDLGVVYRGWNLLGYTMVDVKVKYGILGMAKELDQQYKERNGTCLKISIPRKIFMGLMSTEIDIEIDINITNEARKVSNISIFEFNPRTFVKPASIENLKYERNATTIKLTWNHSNSQMSKKFRIQYSSEYDPKGSWMLTDSRTYKLTLTKLLPYALYNITIEVRPLFENGTETGFWSDSVTTSIRTAEDVPGAVPKLWPGYFLQLDNPEKIKIYWEPIADIKRCGIIQSYRITLKDIVPFGEKENFTEIEDIPPEAISYDIQLEPQKKYEIKLTQRTSVGYPTIDDAHIYVYPQYIRPTLPSLLTVKAIGHSHVLFEWKSTTLNNGSGEFSNYNLSWCKKNGTTPGNCLEAIKSKVIINNNVTNYATVSLNENYFDYWFGISLEQTVLNGWFISSGITWYKHCVYLQGGVPKKPLELEVPTDTDQEDGIFIRWTPYTCSQSEGKVVSYIVVFCTTGSAEDKCQGKEQNETVSPSESSYTLKNLIQGQTYIVNISAKMEDGQYGPWSNSKKVLFKSPKTIESKKENLILGAVIGGVGAFVVLLICGCVYARHRLKKQAEEVKAIDLPAIKTKSGFDRLENNGSGSDAHESLQPLLRNSNGNDSGLGGSSTNGNSISQNNSMDKKYSNQNGSTGGYHSKHNNHIHQNGSVIQTDAIIESPGVSENTNHSFAETSFTTGEMSGGNDMNSVDYTDVELHSSDEESSANNSSCVQSSGLSNNSPKHSGKKSFYSSTNKSNSENKGFTDTDERGQDSSNIDSYCDQGETSAIDSYCEKGFDSGSGIST